MKKKTHGPLTSNPAAIIFDMDGVIVDSMPYHFIAWYEALRPWGVRVNCFDVYSKEGEDWKKTLSDLLRRHKIKPNKMVLRKIFLNRQKIFKKYFRRFVFKGAKDLLLCLARKGYILGLVTGTPLNEARSILPAQILRAFDTIVTGDQVKRGKPYPEPYLEAAKRLKVKPSACVVIENAPLGIASAKKAGMFCIALTTSLPAEYLSCADIVADRLQEIAGIIESSCRVL
ncbi:MAG: HAD family phosphatase [Candidatus Omnitrophota bacterium]|jgi:beta-phosphoglucomutase|nr:MAG: HAD family phosphatase [Candidatus Omnitrophota bacterium]